VGILVSWLFANDQSTIFAAFLILARSTVLMLRGANPDNAPANTAGERIARGAGSGAAAMVAPEAALGAPSELGRRVRPRYVTPLRPHLGPGSGFEADDLSADRRHGPWLAGAGGGPPKTLPGSCSAGPTRMARAWMLFKASNGTAHPPTYPMLYGPSCARSTT